MECGQVMEEARMVGQRDLEEVMSRPLSAPVLMPWSSELCPSTDLVSEEQVYIFLVNNHGRYIKELTSCSFYIARGMEDDFKIRKFGKSAILSWS